MKKKRNHHKEEEEVFEVEKILSHRDIANRRQYFVKWVGYPDSENLWINQEDMCCDELLQEYIENLQIKLSNMQKKQEKENTTRIETLDDAKGIEINKIISATRENGEILYRVITTNNKEYNLKQSIVHSHFKEYLLDFLEDNIKSIGSRKITNMISGV